MVSHGIQSLRAYNFFYFSLLSIFISFLPVYLTFRGVSPGADRPDGRDGVVCGNLVAAVLGYATASLFVGWIVDWLGMDRLTWLFLGYGLLAFVFALAVSDAPASSKKLSRQELKQFFSTQRRCASFCLYSLRRHRTEPMTAFSACLCRASAAAQGQSGKRGFWRRSARWRSLPSVPGCCSAGVRSG